MTDRRTAERRQYDFSEADVPVAIAYHSMITTAVLEVLYECIPPEPDLGQRSAGYVIHAVMMTVSDAAWKVINACLVDADALAITLHQTTYCTIARRDMRDGRLELSSDALESEIASYLLDQEQAA